VADVPSGPSLDSTPHYANLKKKYVLFRVGIVTSYGWTAEGSIPGRAKRFFFISHRPDRFWGPSSFLSDRYQELFSRGVKRLGREADHSSPSSAEIKNDGAIPPLTHTYSWLGA
jgi:hypothetical protein